MPARGAGRAPRRSRSPAAAAGAAAPALAAGSAAPVAALRTPPWRASRPFAGPRSSPAARRSWRSSPCARRSAGRPGCSPAA
eukprot:1519109-Prymnesium_polylepis.1